MEIRFHIAQIAFHQELLERARSRHEHYSQHLLGLPYDSSVMQCEPKKPTELKREAFDGISLSQAIVKAFRLAQEKELTIDLLAERIYIAQFEEEFRACKASIGSALFRGVKKGLFVRVSDGVFRLANKQ